MGIKDLQKGGQNFRMSYGAGNFKQQLSRQTLHGELQNLRDNQKSILEVVDQYKGYIRRNVLGRKLQKQAYQKILKKEGAKLTYGDKQDVKKILKHFSEKDQKEARPEPVPAINRAKAEDPKNPIPDSLVKKVGSRLVINREAENTIPSRPINKAQDFEKKESVLAAKPIKNIERPISVERAEIPAAARPVNIERIEVPAPAKEEKQIDYHALGLIRREKTAPKRSNIQKAEAPIKKTEVPIIHRPINIERAEASTNKLETPIKKTEMPIQKTETPIKKAESPIQKTETPIKKTETPIAPKPINKAQENKAQDFEKKESVLAAKPIKNIEKPIENPAEVQKKEEKKQVDYHALGLIKKKPTPLKHIIIQRAENPDAPELVKAEKKKNPLVHESIVFDEPANIKQMENLTEKPVAENTPPSQAEVQAARGEAVRAKINYEHALNLGGSEAAQEIQKDAFEKMNNLDNSSNN